MSKLRQGLNFTQNVLYVDSFDFARINSRRNLIFSLILLRFLLCCNPTFRLIIFILFIILFRKPKEDLSSAGEQLTSNRVYDGDYFVKASLIEAFFSVIIVVMAKKTQFSFVQLLFSNQTIKQPSISRIAIIQRAALPFLIFIESELLSPGSRYPYWVLQEISNSLTFQLFI